MEAAAKQLQALSTATQAAVDSGSVDADAQAAQLVTQCDALSDAVSRLGVVLALDGSVTDSDQVQGLYASVVSALSAAAAVGGVEGVASSLPVTAEASVSTAARGVEATAIAALGRVVATAQACDDAAGKAR